MFAGFLITFRETLEAALVVGVVIGCLVKTDNRQLVMTVWKGVIAGIAASLAGAYLFNAVAGGFTGRTEEIFEGVTMIAGGILLSTMILWMMVKNPADDLKESVSLALGKTGKLSVFLLVFFSIWREGIETVIFLGSASYMGGSNVTASAISGILSAMVLGWLIYKGMLNFSLKKVFNISSVLLILFAAGLFAHGVHEFQEAGVMPVIVEHVWDINPASSVEGSYHPLHEKGVIGSILKGLFGYNGNPNLLEVITYLVYILSVGLFWNNVKREKIEPVSENKNLQVTTSAA